MVPFEDSIELLANSGLPAKSLFEVGQDHWLADPEPLVAFLRAVDQPDVASTQLKTSAICPADRT